MKRVIVMCLVLLLLCGCDAIAALDNDSRLVGTWREYIPEPAEQKLYVFENATLTVGDAVATYVAKGGKLTVRGDIPELFAQGDTPAKDEYTFDYLVERMLLTDDICITFEYTTQYGFPSKFILIKV